MTDILYKIFGITFIAVIILGATSIFNVFANGSGELQVLFGLFLIPIFTVIIIGLGAILMMLKIKKVSLAEPTDAPINSNDSFAVKSLVIVGSLLIIDMALLLLNRLNAFFVNYIWYSWPIVFCLFLYGIISLRNYSAYKKLFLISCGTLVLSAVLYLISYTLKVEIITIFANLFFTVFLPFTVLSFLAGIIGMLSFKKI